MDNEISGNGNINTAEFWEYDTRLGRRWNIDPVVQPSESPYAVFSNNPIFFNDPSGDTKEKPKVTVNVFGANDANGADKSTTADYDAATKAAEKDPSIINIKVSGGIGNIAKEVKKLEKKYNIEALYLYGHGSTTDGDPEFGFNGIWYNNIDGDKLNIRNFKKDLQTIGSSVSSKCIIGVLGCGTGQLDDNRDNSFIGTIAKETNRTVFAAQGIIMGGNAYGTTPTPLSEVDYTESWEFGQKMHQNTPWYSVAKPSLTNPKGYEITERLFLSINPHGKIVPLVNKKSLGDYQARMKYLEKTRGKKQSQ